MFRDEIKVTFGLSHPNIVQTYDYGEHQNQLYVVMEYCEGRNIKEYQNKLKANNALFPIEISTYIIAQACLGLHHAHNYVDKLTGVNANIIHRDISPQNILINFDGGIKIIDFGIAKAATNSEVTKTGTIKGKLSYLAPEYIDGEELDPRYDEFALGITLWEMLTGQKLFTHQNDMELLKLIRRCVVPAPSTINPLVPKELDEIVLKALSKDRENRYADLGRFNKELMKFLNQFFPDFYHKDLTDLAKILFLDEIKNDRIKMYEFGKIDPLPYLEDLQKEIDSLSKNPDPTAITELTDRFAVLEIEGGIVLERKNEVNFKDEFNLQFKTPEKTRTGLQKREGKTQTVKYQAPLKEKNNLVKKILIIGMICLISIASWFYLNRENATNFTNNLPNFKLKKEVQKKILPPPPPPEKAIQLTNFDIKRMEVFVEGKKSVSSTSGEVLAPTDKEITVRVQTEGRSHYIMPMKITSKDNVEIDVPEMPAAAYGYLITNELCPKGELSYEIYGENITSPIPLPKNIKGIGFPLKADLDDNWAPVVYEVEFKSLDKKITKKLEIHIDREDQNVDLCEMLYQALKK
jgi:serine/threonine-protein kinase